MPEKESEVWQEDYFKDLPEMKPINERVIKNIRKNIYKFSGSTRVAMGLIWSTKKWEKFRKKILNTPLP